MKQQQIGIPNLVHSPRNDQALSNRQSFKKGVKLSRQFALKFQTKYTQKDLKKCKAEFDPEIQQLYKSMGNVSTQQTLQQQSKNNPKLSTPHKTSVSNYHLTSSETLSQNMIASSRSLEGSRKADTSKSPYKIRVFNKEN